MQKPATVNLLKRIARMVALLAGLAGLSLSTAASAERETVLRQIDLPHNYYFREMYLPQLTNGPSSVSWSPDGTRLVYSMRGSLWIQSLDSATARQVTAGPGYDYQPDWSRDGQYIVFTRYVNDAMELHLLDIESGSISALTDQGAVNVEPRWSPGGQQLAWVSTEGSGRFHIRLGRMEQGKLTSRRFREERKSATTRYYYSAFDHELSPTWSPDGTELVYVSNPEYAYGTGGLWRRGLNPDDQPVLVRDEETTWKARPDWSPDGKRVIWSSYLGRQWHQLWLTTSEGGGDPLPLSYGAFDITSVRWSPDGRRIAYISNETGSTELWVMDLPGGKKHPVKAEKKTFLAPLGTLNLTIRDEAGRIVPARVSVTGSDQRSHAPDSAWIHGDDAFDRSHADMELHYFHSSGTGQITLPAGPAQVTVWRGLENSVSRASIMVTENQQTRLTVQTNRLALPAGWASRWVSGDVHVHMNYGGQYRNTPAQLVAQAEAEDLDLVFNLVVNKEQRIPDIAYFSTQPDRASNEQVVLLQAQEFHTGYWGHLGLLGLSEHFLMPDYSAYANTGLASPYPDNSTVADLTHEQDGLVGYVHPYDSAPDPDGAGAISNALPIDVALGKVDYYEVSGFADFRPTQEVWHRLLNCGFRVSAAGGTDAMANFASLRGPVGLNRVYVEMDPDITEPAARRDAWLQGLKAGRTMATNGPLLYFRLDGQLPGGEIKLPAGEHELEYEGFLHSIVPMDHLEVVVNGEVVEVLDGLSATSAEFSGTLKLSESSWVVLRAWNDDASPDVLDRFPFGTTNPVFVEVDGQPIRSARDADYFLAWIARVREEAEANPNYNTAEEKAIVLQHIDAAAEEFSRRR